MRDLRSEFERAMYEVPRNPDAFRKIERELRESDEGSAADRAELAACVFGALALLREVTLEEAREKFLEAKRAGTGNFPALHFGRAAVEQNEPAYALEALQAVDASYFEAQDLHWRNVEVLTLTAEAAVLADDRDLLIRSLLLLNAEFRKEAKDPDSPIPRELEGLLLGQDDAPALLEILLGGLEISAWVYADDLPAISRMLNMSSKVDERRRVLLDIRDFRITPAEGDQLLSRLGPRGDPPLVQLDRQHIGSALLRFERGDFSTTDLERWAEIFECYDDVEYEESSADAISDALFLLATPEINGPASESIADVRSALAGA